MFILTVIIKNLAGDLRKGGKYMNKLISKIVGVALGLTLAVGTGVAFGVSSKNAAREEAAGNDVTFNFASIASANS